VLDAGHEWSADGDVECRVVPLDDSAVENVGAIDPACCMVNLATPGAIEAAAALRASGVATPLWSYVTDGATAAIAIGPVDVVARPVDPDAVRARLEACAAAGANVIMVGRESAVLIPLRQGVQQAGMLVRTAWNRTQAMELTAGRRPDVVILDVAGDAAETAALVGELARWENAPRIVFVAGTTAQHEELRTALHALARDGAPLDRDALRRSAIVASR
jgi:DNA-binding response OmpR family regulator